LGREDQDVADEILKIIREDSIEVLLNTNAVRAESLPSGSIRLIVTTPEGERTLEGSHLLVAVGRTPNTENLNLAAAGVKTDEHGFVTVNERLETNVPGIYALGEVNGGPAFTHISYDDYRIVQDNLLHGKNRTTTDRFVPYVVFIDPQLGRIGLTEQEAKAKKLNYRVAKMPMKHVARALEMGETRGLMKVVVDADSKQILGCAILGIEGGELMTMLEIAMLGKIPYPVLKEAIFAHPTLAEAFNNLFARLD
jgi:pyruvate/2-oxoglutarate dehydrogenase complex dihydrolipoamide dehydrogenase (E3) component